jgi:sulfate transport system permease protein
MPQLAASSKLRPARLAASSKLVFTRFRAHSVLAGFNLALGYTLLHLSLIVLIPLSALFFRTAALGWGGFFDLATGERVLASLCVTFLATFAAAVISGFFGLMVAWVLVRYTFPGKRVVDARVDLPFALPPAVAGITLATLYAPNGWLGHCFAAYP